MENQHRKITGYRELSQAEIDAMNAIKAEGEMLGALVERVLQHVVAQRQKVKQVLRQAEGAATVEEAQAVADPAQDEQQRLDAAQPERWAAIARTHFQEGLMALTRAVAQPGFF